MLDFLVGDSEAIPAQLSTIFISSLKSCFIEWWGYQRFIYFLLELIMRYRGPNLSRHGVLYHFYMIIDV